MKIGIMSMHRVLNYGSFLQALSLKRMIESLGHEVVFVDYKVKRCIDCPLRSHLKKRAFNNDIILKLFKLRRKILGLPPYAYPEHITRFTNSHHILGFSDAKKYHTKTDVLVIGSDEVFNCLQSNPNVGFSMELFGKNNRAKRLISYAASFGNTTYERLIGYNVEKIVARNLKKFDAISVRDANSVSVVEELIGKTPESHLDPVLVGGIENTTFAVEVESLPRYLAVYGYANRFSEAEKNAINEYAKRNGLITVALCEEQDFCEKNIFCKPEEILGYFKNAEVIVTDTFHGTIFSTLFHKPVAIYCRATNSDGYTNTEKLLDLVYKLGLENQLMTENGDLHQTLSNTIDYDKIDEIRRLERERSLEYLRKNLI